MYLFFVWGAIVIVLLSLFGIFVLLYLTYDDLKDL